MPPLQQQQTQSTPNRRQAAQEKLVNTAIQVGVAALYEKTKAEEKRVNTFINGTPLGITKETVIQRLEAIPNEFDRARTFSLLAKNNQFDLSIKTAGAKPEHRQKAKGKIKQLIGDEVRVSLVSKDSQLLETLTHQLERALPGAGERRASIEPWSMTSKGRLRQVLKTDIDGFGAEIQFLPRELAAMANRITHTYYKVIREYDQLAATQKNQARQDSNQKEEAAANQALAESQTRLKLLRHYNNVAGVLNRLLTAPSIDDTSIKEFNKLLANPDKSTETFDAGTEEKNTRTSKKSRFSAVFKNAGEVASYRDYLQAMGKDSAIFPLPILSEETTPKDLESAINKLRHCILLSHACYAETMKTEASEDASVPPFGQMWVHHALLNNQRVADSEKIPDALIAHVTRNLGIAERLEEMKTTVNQSHNPQRGRA